MTATWRGILWNQCRSSEGEAERRYTVCHLVTSDSVTEDPTAVRAAPGVSYLDAYVNDTGALARSIQEAQPSQDTPNIWTVTIEYSTTAANPSEYSTNPLLRIFRPRDFFEKYKKPVWRDVNGSSIRNSAGDLIQGLEKNVNRRVLEWEKNVQSYDGEWASQFLDCLNSAPFYGQAALYWQVDDIRADPQYENGYEFYRVVFRFVHEPDGFQLVEPDKGFFYNHATRGKVRFQTDGVPDPEPRLLDGTGSPLSDAQTLMAGAIDATTNPVTILIDDSTVFPDVPFYIEIEDEILLVTANAANVLTAIRAQQGSTAQSHADNTPVYLAPVALTFNIYPEADFSVFGLA